MSPSPPATSLASSDLWKPLLHCVFFFFKKKFLSPFFSVSVAYGFCLWCYPTFCASINWKELISFASKRKQNKAKWSSKSLWIWAYSRLEGCWCYLKPVYLLGQFSVASQSSQHNFQRGTTCTSRFESYLMSSTIKLVQISSCLLTARIGVSMGTQRCPL